MLSHHGIIFLKCGVYVALLAFPKFVLVYIHTYMHAYIHTYIRTYIHTYIHTFICTYVRTMNCAYVRTIQPYLNVLRLNWTAVRKQNEIWMRPTAVWRWTTSINTFVLTSSTTMASPPCVNPSRIHTVFWSPLCCYRYTWSWWPVSVFMYCIEAKVGPV